MLLKNHIIIETPALTIPKLSDNAQNKLEQVWQLSQGGMTPTEISDLFNKNEIDRKYSNKPYTSKDVGMMKLKYKKRLQRVKKKSVEIGNWKVEFFRKKHLPECIVKHLKRLK